MSVVTIGNFDGIHLGHQAIFRQTLKLATDFNWKSVAFTFTPHPRQAPRLMSDVQKQKAILGLGLSDVIFQPFHADFASLTPQQFMERILGEKLGATHVVVGSNFAFGYQATGKVENLLACSQFQTHVVNPVWIEGDICSSTRVRQAIALGDLGLTQQLLGRSYALSGRVIEGNKRGRELGYPTANLQVEQEVLPPTGVYGVFSESCGHGVMNLGYRPTFESGKSLQIETHFLDFSGDLYGQELEISLKFKIRDEKKFTSPSELKQQIEQDILDSIRHSSD